MRWSIFEKYIHTGHLTVIARGQRREFGQGEPSVGIEFLQRGCLAKILRNPRLNLGETYVHGGWRPAAGSDLYSVLKLLRINFEQRYELGKLSVAIQVFLDSLTAWNTLAESRRNIAQHYDLEEALFRACLDRDMHYSCAYFTSTQQDLESAQQDKCEYIARKLCLQPGQQVLDIGCGWGSLGLYLAQHFGVRVTGLTLSVEQLRVAKQQAYDRGLQDLVDFQLQDYRLHTGAYDRVVSVGMFEHSGRTAYKSFFQAVERLLKPAGVALIHAIGNERRAGVINRWIRRHVFPSGHIPSIGQVIPAIEVTDLRVVDLECLRFHYARTLGEWHSRFTAQRAHFVAKYGEQFCRTWEFYLAICQTAFEVGGLAVYHWQLQRPGGDIPMTRDYLYR
ncbi:MAG TPA: SAM-dependent methyltransferase [Gammaproteobacteria bacterium]|nr:SAM-dependent methyltransferase [Gammaproteobacteria bacterium]|tara:strand:+ start:238 stop:1413 length:1176 start_codon:yes stop_codon:yes gene_type:complete